jgi:hypothetical protein
VRRALLTTCLAFVLLTWPVDAQQPPAQPAHEPAGPGGGRVIMDVVFWALPGEADEACMRLSPGRVEITVSLEAAGMPQPVRYRFAPYSYRASDSPPEIDTRVTADPRTFEATLAGGRYCYSILNEGGPTDSDAAGSVGQSQLVAVKMTLSP